MNLIKHDSVNNDFKIFTQIPQGLKIWNFTIGYIAYGGLFQKTIDKKLDDQQFGITCHQFMKEV